MRIINNQLNALALPVYTDRYAIWKRDGVSWALLFRQLWFRKHFFSVFSAGSIYSVVEALLRFLDSLSEPVIPARYQDRCLRVFHDWFACKQVIAELSPVCYKTVFNYLVKFLKRVLDHQEQNGTNASAIGKF